MAGRLIVDGALRKEIREALVAAFASPLDLRMMVSEALDVDVADITQAADPEVAAFDVIKWFLVRGRLSRLVTAAAQARPGDLPLRALAEQFRQVRMIDGAVRRELREALLEVFGSLDRYRMCLSEELNVDLPRVTQATSLPAAAFESILWFLGEGRLPDLVAAALKHRASPRLQALAGRLEPEEGGAAEQVVLRSAPFLRGAVWDAKFAQARRAVCRIEPQPYAESTSGFGTGFLVGPDLVLTASHVAAWLPKIGPGRAVLRFDYEYGLDGVSLPKGRECALAENWKLIDSPSNGGFDFALVRLAAPFDDGRDYLRPVGHAFEKDEPLLIVQHPEGEAMCWAPGFVVDPMDGDRVQYNVNTKPGSSGSPCFTFDLGVVAVHYWGSESYNRGMRFSSILQFLKTQENALAGKGLAGFLGLTK